MPDTTSRSPIKHDGYKAVRAREGQRVCHHFFVLFYCTDVCYRPLGSVNSSTRVPELAKSSLSCLLDCPPPSFLPIQAHPRAYPCPHPLPFVLRASLFRRFLIC